MSAEEFIIPPTGSLRTLRPHQERALQLLKQTVANGNKRPVLQAPTGAGKTVIAAHIVDGALAKRKRLIFVVPFLSLIDQTFFRFVENGIDPHRIGVIQGDHPWHRPDAEVQIATAQTLARRGEIPPADVVIVDECHILYRLYKDWFANEQFAETVFIGLSATPWAVGMGKLYQALLRPTSLGELIDEGYLSKFRVFAPSKPELDDIDLNKRGDYDETQLGERMSQPELVGDIVSTWTTQAQDRPTLCFAVNLKHAAFITESFEKAGVRAGMCDKSTPRDQRTELGRQLASGELQVVVNVGTLTTGIDWDVRCLILARPTRSEILFLQIVGRGLRTAEGKDYCLILDHSDTHARLGMVTDIDHPELHDGTRSATAERKKRENKTPLPKCCPSCAELIPAMQKACNCGWKPPIGVTHKDGALVEFGGGGTRGRVPSLAEALYAMGRSSVFDQLERIRLEAGYKRGWTAHKYKSIFGTWPNRQKYEGIHQPTPELRRWLQLQRTEEAMQRVQMRRERDYTA